MKYLLNIRSRPAPTESVTDAHERVLKVLQQIRGQWGIVRGVIPSVYEPISTFLSAVPLTGMVGKGIRGSLNYYNRQALRDDASCDDWINLEFNPTKVDYAHLVDVVFPRLVIGLKAYVGEIKECQLVAKDFERWRRSKANLRDGVFRIHPVAYWDRQLCKRAFGLTPIQVAKRLGGAVDRVSPMRAGVLTVVSSKILPTDEIVKIDKRLQPLLTSE